eukprot:5690357-Alexandrium_andersonii.AAC.1
MSASLVGSEMCIRDSSRRVRGSFALSARLARELALVVSGPPPRWETGAAVSYTHLTLPTICSV